MQDHLKLSEKRRDLTNQLYACFHTLPNPNLAWLQLIRLVDPNAHLQWGRETAYHGRAPTAFKCWLSRIPHNTMQADIAALFEMISIQCTSINLRGKSEKRKADLTFSSQNDLDLALTMDKFVLYSEAAPIAVGLLPPPKLHTKPLLVSQSESAAARMCDIGVTLEEKRTKWQNPHKREFTFTGVYIMAIVSGKGAEAAKLPLYGRLVKVNGTWIGLNKKLADDLLVGAEGTEVQVEVNYCYKNPKTWETVSFRVTRR